MAEMISLEEARELVLSQVAPLPVETVGLLDAVGRVAADDLKSDIDVSPFAHSAMDGFALHAAEREGATAEAPVEMDVNAEIAAGMNVAESTVRTYINRMLEKTGYPNRNRLRGAAVSKRLVVPGSLFGTAEEN